ncbi:uncharacterized protein LOC143357630 [Halictus rubicundus]|uniref:uncharacterized protein LOC143357630 n=1 Tax=Halictus rubicundus TaxID=77578 RepID=UPI00403752D8
MRLAQNRDISIEWTCLLMKSVGLWLAADEAEQRRRNAALIYTINAISIATCIAFRDIYYSWGNVSDCVFISCNILYLMIVLFKIAVLYVHKTEFHELVRYTQKNFWHSDYSYEEKLILDDCRRVSGVFIIVLSFCVQGTCAGYMVTPLIANIGKNDTDRVLPFNMWVSFPTGKSPYFETLFTIQILCVYHVGICYICFDNFLCLVNLQVASQFRILQHRLNNLNISVEIQIDHEASLSECAKVYQAKLANCVRYHQALGEYCKYVENVFTMIILGQVLFLSLIICLVSYQLFLADIPPSRNVSLIMNLMGTLCQLLMFTYSCDGIIRQSSDVSKAILSGPWPIMPMDTAGKSLRKNVLLMLLRSSRSCCLTASGFFPVSLETYTGVLSTAMSYFTLLRQQTIDSCRIEIFRGPKQLKDFGAPLYRINAAEVHKKIPMVPPFSLYPRHVHTLLIGESSGGQNCFYLTKLLSIPKQQKYFPLHRIHTHTWRLQPPSFLSTRTTKGIEIIRVNMLVSQWWITQKHCYGNSFVTLVKDSQIHFLHYVICSHNTQYNNHSYCTFLLPNYLNISYRRYVLFNKRFNIVIGNVSKNVLSFLDKCASQTTGHCHIKLNPTYQSKPRVVLSRSFERVLAGSLKPIDPRHSKLNMRADETKDFSLFVTSFYMKLTGIWSAINPDEERHRRNSFAFAISLLFLAVFVELMDLYHVYSTSFQEIIYITCNLATVALVICKMFILHLHRKQLCDIIAYAENNFWHTNYDSCEKAFLDQCKHLCIVFICYFNFFAQGTAFSYVIEPLVEYFSANVTTRRLPFNFYNDFVLRPYIFEITFVFQTLCMILYGIGYLCVDNFLCITNLHAATQFRILQYRITNMHKNSNMKKHSGVSRELSACYADNCYAVFRDCIRQHQALISYCRKVDDLFTLIVLGQVLIFSILICLDGYLMLLDEASPYRRVVFTFHLIGTITQLLMFTYSCDCLMRASSEIAESVYTAQWTVLPMNNGGKMLRNDMQLVIMRSREPCSMSAGGFFMVSLQTYTKVLSTAVSYFTLLRNY